MNRPGADSAANLDRVLEEFEEAWHDSAVPQIETYIARIGGEQPRTMVELIKLDLEYRWRLKPAGGTPWALEDYLNRYPRFQAPVELIAEEYRVRQRWGDKPGHAEYGARFPQQGDGLLEALRGVDAELTAEFARPPANVLVAQPVEPVASLGQLVEKIGDYQLLSSAQMVELTTQLQRYFPAPRALASELLQRNWLTAYQVNQLLQGRGGDLRLGPYLLLERLGEGGTGWVFKALHQHMNRLVAIKLLRRELLADTEVLARFYREIEVISQLTHPHVVHAYDAGPIGDRHVLVMEYAAGVDLARLVKKSGPLDVPRACDYVCQAASGLQYIHERGLVHRDVKPSNLLVSGGVVSGGVVSGGVVSGGSSSPHSSPLTPHHIKILDLGLSGLGRVETHMGAINHVAVDLSGRLTPVGAMVMGTPDYLAPEQALDFHQADIRADIYGLGCTFFYLLTGQPPFPGGTLVRKLVRHQQADPPTLERLRPEVPRELLPIMSKMLAKSPEERYQTPAEFLAALRQIMPQMCRDDAITAGHPYPASCRPEDETRVAQFSCSRPLRGQPGSQTPATAGPGSQTPATAESLSESFPLTSEPASFRRGNSPRRGLLVSVASLTVGLMFAIVGYMLWPAASTPPARPTRPAAPPVVRIAPIGTLHSTGLGGNGAPLADGDTDPHWTITATPAGETSARAYATIDRWPVGSAWMPNHFSSRWISPQADESRGDPPGEYVYRTPFDLTGFDPTTARITLRVAADNRVTDVRLNGRSLGLVAVGFAAFTTGEINRGFVPGRNTLEFVVRNDGDTIGSNPSGFRVELTGSAAIAPRP